LPHQYTTATGENQATQCGLPHQNTTATIDNQAMQCGLPYQFTAGTGENLVTRRITAAIHRMIPVR
jgi:hypothetical protein